MYFNVILWNKLILKGMKMLRGFYLKIVSLHALSFSLPITATSAKNKIIHDQVKDAFLLNRTISSLTCCSVHTNTWSSLLTKS